MPFVLLQKDLKVSIYRSGAKLVTLPDDHSDRPLLQQQIEDMRAGNEPAYISTRRFTSVTFDWKLVKLKSIWSDGST